MSDLSRVEDLLSAHPLIDGHNDLLWEIRARGLDVDTLDLDSRTPLHTDWPRAASGRLGGQFWSVYVPGTLAPADAVVAVLEQIDAAKRLIARYPDRLGLALTADDVERVFASGRNASLLGAVVWFFILLAIAAAASLAPARNAVRLTVREVLAYE